MKIVAENSESITLDVSQIPHHLANAIRRTIIKEVPTMAVEEVLIIENSSNMTNEVLAHRISLIPFITDLENYRLPEECDCQSRLGCEKCVVRFTLRAEAAETSITVYSCDITPEKKDGIVAPFTGDIPVVALTPGQRVELELYVRLGKGRKHSKWQPGIVTLYDENGKKYMYVESYGFLPPRRMVVEAVKILKEKVATLENAFRGL